MKAFVEANLAQFKQRVKLNVGGSKFETTLSTLTRYPESMLGAMFSGGGTSYLPMKKVVSSSTAMVHTFESSSTSCALVALTFLILTRLLRS